METDEMREINFIAIHCSDSDIPAHDSIEVIRDWHCLRNMIDIGYHFVITQDGVIHDGRPVEKIGAHIKGNNANSIGICLTGRHKFSSKQFQSLNNICRKLCEEFGLTKLDILPHNYFDPKKTCPNFPLEEVVSSWDWH